MSWTDFHSHLLPCIDDGATSIEISMKMLQAAWQQGVKTIVATPHYKLTDESPDVFAKKRNDALAKLASFIEGEEFPHVVAGCEIMLSQHLDEKDLSELAVKEFNAMLFEFPFTGFRPWIVDEIENIAFKYKITPIIAHFERYFPIQPKYMDALTSIEGIVFQFNNSALQSHSAVKCMKELLAQNIPIVLSSDAHGTEHRPYDFDIPNGILNGHSVFQRNARNTLKQILNSPAPFFQK